MIRAWFPRRRPSTRAPAWLGSLPFEGPTDFPQLAVVLYVLRPGESIGMYVAEAYTRFPAPRSTA